MNPTVHGAVLQRAVVSGETFRALTLSVDAAASVVTVLGTRRFRAVGTFPAGLTHTAARFSAVVSVTVAVRFSSHLTFDRRVKTESFVIKINNNTQIIFHKAF